jgi:hypothetical protein
MPVGDRELIARRARRRVLPPGLEGVPELVAHPVRSGECRPRNP